MGSIPTGSNIFDTGLFGKSRSKDENATQMRLGISVQFVQKTLFVNVF